MRKSAAHQEELAKAKALQEAREKEAREREAAAAAADSVTTEEASDAPAADAAPKLTRLCPVCGARYEEGTLFCPEDGARTMRAN